MIELLSYKNQTRLERRGNINPLLKCEKVAFFSALKKQLGIVGTHFLILFYDSMGGGYAFLISNIYGFAY